jgi:hypothetical protein
MRTDQMMLTEEQVAAIKRQLDIEALEESNPSMDMLRKQFGEHTFYVGEDGLYMFEGLDAPSHPGQPANMVQVGAWTDENRNAMKPVKHNVTDVLVDLAG